MLPYAIRQLVWMLTSALQLLYALSTGVVWVAQMLRLFLYGACAAVCFVPHWWWYLTSPNIIHRVSYRLSETTKRRNMLRMLEAEGMVDFGAMPSRYSAQATLPLPSTAAVAAAARRPRRPATLAATRLQDGAVKDSNDTQSRQRPACGLSSAPHRRLAASLAPSSTAHMKGEEEASYVGRRPHRAGVCHRLTHAVDGEVDDHALFQWHPSSRRSPRGCREASRGVYAQRATLGLSNKALGFYPDAYDNIGVVTSPLQSCCPHRRGPPPPPLRSAPTESRCDGTEDLTRNSPDVTAVEQPTHIAMRHTSPYCESLTRSSPLQRRHESHSHLCTIEEATALSSHELEGTEKQQQVHSGPFMVAMNGKRAHGSSSSSTSAAVHPQTPWCDPSRNDPPALRAVPGDSPEKQTGGRNLNGSQECTRVFAGRPVYYETLPMANASSDPILRDVLSNLEEVSEMSVEPSQRDQASRPCARRQPSSAAPRRPRRQSEAPPQKHCGPAAREPLARTLSMPHVCEAFSTENLFAGLDKEDEEDRLNLHNRATVDIVLPTPLDALMKTLKYACQNTQLRRKRFPIIIDVSGAVWIIGSHLWSTMMARLFAARGYIVFCPDYRNFPQTTMEGMTLDISDAIAWVLNNAERYNGDLSNVTLIGQSAGAHLTMMSLLSQAQLSAYQYNAQQGIHQGVPPPSDVAYNVPRYNPRESIHRYVGLSGMYNIEGLVDHFQARGLSKPVLYQIAGGKAQMARYSIHAYFDDRRGGDTGEVLPDNIFDFLPQRMFFMHGDADKCAPLGESSSLVGMLRAAQARYTLRRNVRNEEARRHAQRSRRFFPRPMAAAAGEEKISSTTTAAGVFPPLLARSWSQPAVEVTSAIVGDGALDAAASSSDNQEKMLDNDLVDTDVQPHSTQQQPQDRSHAVVPPAVSVMTPTNIRPIIPPAREDYIQRPVDLCFIVISGGRHLDAFVDECIAASRSSCVDFLCDYESVVNSGRSNTTASPVCRRQGLERGVDGTISPSVQTSPVVEAKRNSSMWVNVPGMMVMPDAVLPLAVPHEERSLPLRLCTLICPF
ncbi:hypothetical protein JKF63_06076 [Porcisia hertigi]|uniref:BD-FAE-like domain-containing protein n=1 Tax=Porcisia hertigi TaxID=2761500 RepID=A0A836IZ43_9TRYP|nr:hypothetical protein JKF63_06076 [Porcisia hertigi]